jgi:hypothetical protein
MTAERRLAIFYEHPHWFLPLFTELERRGIPFARLDAAHHDFDPALAGRDRWLVFNRMSPSAWTRGRGAALAYTRHFLASLEAQGVPVFNGSRAFEVETSKALQVALVHGLGLDAPRTRVVHDPARLLEAQVGLEFPLVVKPSIGGSGAGVARFDDARQLAHAVAKGTLEAGLDGTLLLQEFHPPDGRSIVRIETLEGRYLYGIRIHLAPDAGFDLCPADVCRTVEGDTLSSSACPAGAAKAGLSVEAFDPPARAIEAVERIVRAASIDVGGVEYLDSTRDGRRYYYDVNALSNFVADPRRVVGFDPTERLVDALLRRARETSLEGWPLETVAAEDLGRSAGANGSLALGNGAARAGSAATIVTAIDPEHAGVAELAHAKGVAP